MLTSRQGEILLESGTNELEIMEFTVGGEVFGINVAKVREIMVCAPVKPMQNAHPCIEGIFKPRDEVITVINLQCYLGLEDSGNPQRDIFMITHFNNQVFAFHVHTVQGIDRISWKSIQKPNKIIYGGRDGIATGIAECEDRLITILDFEKIVSEISPEAGIQYQDLAVLGARRDSEKTILLVEDSMFLSRMILESLRRTGYTRTVKCDNGLEAWEYLQTVKEAAEPAESMVHCIITDVEMPQMDGYHLTKLIKEDRQLGAIPVILFSSLADEELYQKGQQLGANAQVTKPDIATLVVTVDSLVSNR